MEGLAGLALHTRPLATANCSRWDSDQESSVSRSLGTRNPRQPPCEFDALLHCIRGRRILLKDFFAPVGLVPNPRGEFRFTNILVEVHIHLFADTEEVRCYDIAVARDHVKTRRSLEITSKTITEAGILLLITGTTSKTSPVIPQPLIQLTTNQR